VYITVTSLVVTVATLSALSSEGDPPSEVSIFYM